MSRANRERKARRRRERGAPVSNRTCHIRDSATLGLRHISYTITEEALHLPGEADPSFWRAFRDDERQKIHEWVQLDPPAAIQRLEPLIEKFPNTPMLLNWLSAAYSNLGREDKAEELMRLNYERNPDYLFARANYAEMCLARGELDRVREIFDDKFDLKLMYPRRDVFHITEFIAFSAVAIEYFARVGEWKAADSLYAALKEVAPDHPATAHVGNVLSRSFLARAIDRLRRRLTTSPRSSRRR